MGWLTAIGNALKAAAIALGWMKQVADQQTGIKLQEGATATANLETVQAELKASVDAPKTESDTLARLDGGTA